MTWLCRVLVAVCGISVALCAILCCGAWTLVVARGLQSVWASAVVAWGPTCVTRALVVAACGLSSCGTWTPKCAGSVVVVCRLSCSACGILVPRPGSKPMSPALQGEFLTTGPPRKSQQ